MGSMVTCIFELYHLQTCLTYRLWRKCSKNQKDNEEKAEKKVAKMYESCRFYAFDILSFYCGNWFHIVIIFAM